MIPAQSSYVYKNSTFKFLKNRVFTQHFPVFRPDTSKRRYRILTFGPYHGSPLFFSHEEHGTTRRRECP
jgi:hypothetical protein